ncbi:MAG TPA: SpoIID/LytB domain-containing protein [Candidatus Saccharimonadales bacterium]|nr:SpoIID/LytB domain-containing protein [Candidatus Saccharimonadales bacterium]
MKKILSFVFVISLILISLFFLVQPNKADQIDDLTTQINNLTSALNMSVNATKPLESQLTSMEQQIADIKTRVAQIETDVATKQQIINTSEKDLAAKQQMLNAAIRDYYIKSFYNNPLVVFFSVQNAADITQVLAYQKAAENQDKAIITNIALSITSLEQQQADLENEKSRLAVLQANLDDQSAKLDKIVAGAKAYQASLSTQIAQLSAQQQSLLAAKYATLGISSSAYNMSSGCSSDILPGAPDPGFSPRFAFFSYGVPNRVGMNQYGAMGRAQAGQSYSQILSAYYNADLTTGYSQSINIHVTGTNDYGESIDQNLSIEDYLKHIYEIPASWPTESLKAQAIAARSYALAYTNNGASSICTDQHCQEFKQELNSQAWIDAVNATAGQVLTTGGQPIKAWFSSTHGGYEFTSSDIGWSSTSYTKRLVDASGSVNSFSDLQNNAYDKGSPWFYCDWGSRSGTAWLHPSEVADIANVVMLAQADSSTDEHLYQTDKPNPANTDTWDSGRVQQELHNRGITPFTTVSSVSVDADFSTGRVTTVHVNGDAGSQSFSGDFFKTYFDLRAPANIQIVGPLYNIEQR